VHFDHRRILFAASQHAVVQSFLFGNSIRSDIAASLEPSNLATAPIIQHVSQRNKVIYVKPSRSVYFIMSYTPSQTREPKLLRGTTLIRRFGSFWPVSGSGVVLAPLARRSASTATAGESGLISHRPRRPLHMARSRRPRVAHGKAHLDRRITGFDPDQVELPSGPLIMLGMV